MLTQELGTIIGFAEIAIVLAIVLAVRRHRQRRTDPSLAEAWDQWQAASTHGFGIARILWVYQHARRGSKALIIWRRRGRRRLQDAWFEARQQRSGCYVLLRGSVGWGPHNSNPRVFYVRPDGVLGTLPGRAPRAWRREQKRLRRQAPRQAPLPRSFPDTP